MEHGEQYEEQGLLVRTRSSGSYSYSEGSHNGEVELDELEDASSVYSPSSASSTRWWHPRWSRPRHSYKAAKPGYFEFSRPRRRRSIYVRFCQLFSLVPYTILGLILTFGVFFPSYSNPPQRYVDLRERVLSSNETGSANLNNEKVFIAASLYDTDGGLVSGDWGQSVLHLINILGHDNVFLSVYENDPSEESIQALETFRQRSPCNSSIVHEHLDLTELPHVAGPDGSTVLKRIAFLAEVRNRALRPLNDTAFNASQTRWDKLLYLNDVIFDPIDAANLLFNTNLDQSTGKTNYRAACAVDFINPFKFYDTFATRDLEGYNMGVPFYPWFSGGGEAKSRQDVLNQTDAVRVKSCWGGMVAFEAKWFQPHLYEFDGHDLIAPEASSTAMDKLAVAESAPTPMAEPTIDDVDEWLETPADSPLHGTPIPAETGLEARSLNTSTIPPLRFRSEPDTFWDASECCLIHADLSHRPSSSPTVSPTTIPPSDSTGIYMNPYIRVAYSKAVLTWLPFTKRFERLYTPIHSLVDLLAGRPGWNPRRLEQPGDEVVDRVWSWDDASLAALRNGTVDALPGGLRGSFREVKRVASPGQFCGSRKLLYIKEDTEEGESHWGSAKVPIVDG